MREDVRGKRDEGSLLLTGVAYSLLFTVYGLVLKKRSWN